MLSIVQSAVTHCLDLMTNSRCYQLPFHNLDHTLEVYRHALKIAAYENLTQRETEIIAIAALFHDTGNAETFDGHEEVGANNALLFLRQEDYPEKRITDVVNCIGATRTPQRPMNKLERVICDADLFHLGTKYFLMLNERLRTEWESHQNLYYSDLEWYGMNIDFLNDHDFHTAYGKQILEPVKQQNITLFESILTNIEYI